jgi:hypothetical protein
VIEDENENNKIVPTDVTDSDQNVSIMNREFQVSARYYNLKNTFDVGGVVEKISFANIKYNGVNKTAAQVGFIINDALEGEPGFIMDKEVGGVQVGITAGHYTFDVIDKCSAPGVDDLIFTTHFDFQVVPVNLSYYQVTVKPHVVESSETYNVKYGYDYDNSLFEITTPGCETYNFHYKLLEGEENFAITHGDDGKTFLQLKSGRPTSSYYFKVGVDMEDTVNYTPPADTAPGSKINVINANLPDYAIYIHGPHLTTDDSISLTYGTGGEG